MNATQQRALAAADTLRTFIDQQAAVQERLAFFHQMLQSNSAETAAFWQQHRLEMLSAVGEVLSAIESSNQHWVAAGRDLLQFAKGE